MKKLFCDLCKQNVNEFYAIYVTAKSEDGLFDECHFHKECWEMMKCYLNHYDPLDPEKFLNCSLQWSKEK